MLDLAANPKVAPAGEDLNQRRLDLVVEAANREDAWSLFRRGWFECGGRFGFGGQFGFGFRLGERWLEFLGVEQLTGTAGHHRSRYRDAVRNPPRAVRAMFPGPGNVPVNRSR